MRAYGCDHFLPQLKDMTVDVVIFGSHKNDYEWGHFWTTTIRMIKVGVIFGCMIMVAIFLASTI